MGQILRGLIEGEDLWRGKRLSFYVTLFFLESWSTEISPRLTRGTLVTRYFVLTSPPHWLSGGGTYSPLLSPFPASHLLLLLLIVKCNNICSHLALLQWLFWSTNRTWPQLRCQTTPLISSPPALVDCLIPISTFHPYWLLNLCQLWCLHSYIHPPYLRWYPPHTSVCAHSKK